MNKINAIYYPNTESMNGELIVGYYINENKAPMTSLKNTVPVDEINRFEKTGDNAPIGWFEIISNKKVIAEIKESICNIYY